MQISHRVNNRHYHLANNRKYELNIDIRAHECIQKVFAAKDNFQISNFEILVHLTKIEQQY